MKEKKQPIKRYVVRKGDTILLYPSLYSVLPEPLHPLECSRELLAADLEDGRYYEAIVSVKLESE